MAVFKEGEIVERMHDPEERQAKDIQRGDRNFGDEVKVKSTSVTVNRYRHTMNFVRFLIYLIIFIVCGFFIYKGIDEFIPKGG